LQLPDAVLGAEAATEFVHQIMDRAPRFGLARDEGVVIRTWRLIQIEVQISIAYVPVRDEPPFGNILRDPRRGVLDELRQYGHGQRHVMLQARAVEALRFGNGLAQLPKGCALPLILR